MPRQVAGTASLWLPCLRDPLWPWTRLAAPGRTAGFMLGAEGWSQLPVSPFLGAKGEMGPLASRGAEGCLRAEPRWPQGRGGHSRDALCAGVLRARALSHHILWALPTSQKRSLKGELCPWFPGSVTGTARTQTCLRRHQGAPWRAWEPFLLFLFFKRSAV